MIGRIRSRDTFDRLRRDGIRLRVDPLWCTFLPAADLRSAYVAFAIGRSTGNAVVRNRLRRRLRALMAGSDAVPGWYLIGAAPGATELTFGELATRVDELLREARRRAPSWDDGR